MSTAESGRSILAGDLREARGAGTRRPGVAKRRDKFFDCYVRACSGMYWSSNTGDLGRGSSNPRFEDPSPNAEIARTGHMSDLKWRHWQIQ
jgi:hypothetical protein